MAADIRFTEGYKRLGWVFLVLGIAAYAGEGALIIGFHYPYPGAESFSWTYVLFNIVISIGNFCWVMFILSLTAKYMNFNNKALTYGSEAVLPFYIFHQTIILCVGWFVIRWNMGIGPKYLIIALVSFALIMALVRPARQTFQRDAVFLRHATKEEAFKNTRPEPGKDFRLIVKRLDRVGGGKVNHSPISRCT